jgi:hypothetical protein
MSNEGFMKKEDQLYFNEYFNEYQKNGQISFDNFSLICKEFKGITDKVVLEETLKDLRTSLDKKNVIQTLYLKQDEYNYFVNTVLKDQAQSKNQNDPEMEKLFKSLAGKEGDYVYKKKLSDIITMFDLPINLNTFFQPVGGQEELNFNEFCCLFRPEKVDENLRKTFITLIDKSSKEPDEKEDIKAIYKANFPIKYYGD